MLLSIKYSNARGTCLYNLSQFGCGVGCITSLLVGLSHIPRSVHTICNFDVLLWFATCQYYPCSLRLLFKVTSQAPRQSCPPKSTSSTKYGQQQKIWWNRVHIYVAIQWTEQHLHADLYHPYYCITVITLNTVSIVHLQIMEYDDGNIIYGIRTRRTGKMVTCCTW